MVEGNVIEKHLYRIGGLVGYGMLLYVIVFYGEDGA